MSARPATATDAHSKAVPADCLDEGGVSLYVHFPFCVSKCRYCDFNSYAWTDQDLRAHAEAVLLEAERRAEDLAPQTVFFGGGTPSLLEPTLLHEFLDRLHAITGFRDSASEVTMEANPESLDLATAVAARDGGVDRISIGFQSLRREVLRAYDRVHEPEDAIRAFHATREAGVERINVDMIYAFPGQDPESWFRDLEQVQALGPEHLSCYELTYEPGTSLTRLRDAGRWQAEDLDLCLKLFIETRARNEAAGYHGYEVSAFAKDREASRHNLAYWRSLDYVGIGAGAAGWDGVVRRKNFERPEIYEAAVRNGKDPVDQSEACPAETILFDALMMGLRLQEEGVDLGRLKRISGLDLLQESQDLVHALRDEGLIEILADTLGQPRLLRATTKGFLLLDDILQRFLPEDPALQV